MRTLWIQPFWLWLAALLVASSLRAETVTVTVESTGVTQQQATANALIEAIRQVNGVSISSSEALQTLSVSGAYSDSEGNSSEFSLTQQHSSTVGAKAKGHVASYQVLDMSPTETGFQATVEANIHRYKTPGIDNSNRRKLAVVPFGSRAGSIDFFGSISGQELAHLLHQAVVAQFVQSRRFSILDRETRAILGERAFITYQETPVSEKVRLGQALGADYLVVGEVVDAGGAYEEQVGTITGMVKDSSYAGISVAYRIVVPATGEIKFADNIDLSVSALDGKTITSRTNALNELAKQLVGIALDRIYPIQIVNVSADGTVVLNQGGGTLSIGDQLALVELGKAITDPYTKEPLGRTENIVGQIEIIRSDGKLAYARAITNVPSAIKVGQLARRLDQNYSNANQIDPPTERTEGVYLPFD